MSRLLLLAAAVVGGCTRQVSPIPYTVRQINPLQEAGIAELHKTVMVGPTKYSLVVVSPQRAPRPMPVLIALHGRGGNGQGAIAQFNLAVLAVNKGFLLVAPDAQGGQWHDVSGDPLQVRDLAFFHKLFQKVTTWGGDPARIYVVGFSNGGGMTHYLAATFPDMIAAVGTGGASVGSLDDALNYHGLPNPSRPIPVLMFHGMQDQLCGYDMSTFTVAAPDSARWWAKADHLDLTPRHKSLAGGELQIDTYGSPGGIEVRLMSYRNMGHAWPTIEDANTGQDFNEQLWDFISRNR